MAKAKGKGKKAPTAKQQANWDRFAREARARAKANRAANPASSTSSSSDPDAAAAKRRRAAKKAAKTRSSWSYRAKKALTDHPVRSLLVLGLGAGAAHRPTRKYVVEKGSAGVQAVKAFVMPPKSK